MKSRPLIIIGIVVMISILAASLLVFQPSLQSMQCDIGFLPKAHASLIYSSIYDVYQSADVIVVGTIQIPSNGTNFLVDVSEYVKNPLQENMLILNSPYPPSNIINSEQMRLSPNDHVLLFLNGPNKENRYEIIPYSIEIPTNSMSGKDLIKGMDVRVLEKSLMLEQGQSSKFVLCLDSFFDYAEMVPLKVLGFSIYDSSGNGESFEDPAKLEEFGVILSMPTITAVPNNTVAFEIPVHIQGDAMKGRYFINIEHKDANSFEWMYWKRGAIQLQVFLE